VGCDDFFERSLLLSSKTCGGKSHPAIFRGPVKNFWNPTSIERIDPVWDFPLMSALLHFRGEGRDVPDPEIRWWIFPNGFGVQALLSRDFLLIGVLMYDVSAGPVHEGKLLALSEETVPDSGLPPEIFNPRERQTAEEVDEYLDTVKNFQMETVERKNV
jgi:hypothetical protein